MNTKEINSNLAQKVFDVFTQTTSVNPNELSLEVEIESVLGDSLELFSLICALEKEFSLKADYTELINIRTIGDIVAYLSKKGF